MKCEIVTDPLRLTPITEHRGYMFKRVDAFRPFGFCGVNGGKLRQCIALLNKHSADISHGVITGTSVHSPQAAIVSAVCRSRDIKCVVCYGGTSEKCVEYPYPRIVKRNLAQIDISCKSGRTSVLHHYIDSNYADMYHVRYGFDLRKDMDCFVTSVARQCKNLPDVLDSLTITVGSGITLCGVLIGLSMYGKRVGLINAVGCAPNRRAKIESIISMYNELNSCSVNTSNMNYVDAFNDYDGFRYDDVYDGVYWGGYNLHPRYEAKMFRWVLANVPQNGRNLIWITGSDFNK